MVTNKHIQVVNENGTTVVLSGAIIVEYLKDYTSDWGSISTSANLTEIESQFAPSDLEDPVNKNNIDVFNGKIGFVLPKITLNSLINEVIFLLKKEDMKYLTIFQSFNNLEKVAMYFILMLGKNRTVPEIFDMINANYKDISKRDIMIKLLSEVDIVESNVDVTDPINGFFRFLTSVPTHNPKPKPSFTMSKGEIEFKEFTFPMHSYNTTKAFTEPTDINSSNDSVRNYYDRFKDTWKANQKSKASGWFSSSSPLYIKTFWKDVLKNSIFSQISTVADEDKKDISSYRGVLDQLSWRNIYFHTTNEKPLFKYLGENFFDFSPNSGSTDDLSSNSPLTMTKYTSDDSITNKYFTSSNLTTGYISYSLNDFKDFKTLLSYYMSDLNIWLTSDYDGANNALTDYLHTQGPSGFLTSNAKCETKGYFSNIMFIQSAIQRVLYPIILKTAQNGYEDSDYSLSDSFKSDSRIYDSIFDSIVNNSFVYTDRLNNTADFENNYEIIPNRAILQTPNPNTDLVNYKATNLYEFIINSLVYGKNDVVSKTFRKVIDGNRINSYTRQSLLYKNGAINYNPIDSKLSMDVTTLTVNDFGTESITYNFGTNYNPTTNNWIDKIVTNFFRMDGDTETYSKINYRDMKFFKIPVHSSDEPIRKNMNRYINRVNRELLTDISDLANFDIKGLSLADFTYGEKALLKEYIENFKSIRLANGKYSDLYVIEEMIKDLDFLIAWKSNPESVALNNPNNIYYQISELANPKPVSGKAIDFYNWFAKMSSLKKTVYFPEILSVNNINIIKDLLNRAILKINRNRNIIKNSTFVSQVKAFIADSAIDVGWVGTTAPSASNKIQLTSIGTNFLNALKLIVSHIKQTTDYSEVFDSFSTAYRSGIWNDILTTTTALRDVLLEDELIQTAITQNGLYSGYMSGILKDLDLGLYKLTINNYFSYLVDPNTLPQSNLVRVILKDNSENGLIKYYSDLITLLKFTDTYYKLVPEFVKYLNNNVLNKYYEKIKAIKSLPTWDYESLHRRSLEKDLKNTSGINAKDYNITWAHNSSNIIMVYKSTGGFSHSYKVTPFLYRGGLSEIANNNEYRDRWWRRWLNDSGNAFSESDISAFKIPHVNIKDCNIEFPSTWEYDSPTSGDKYLYFYKMKHYNETYQSGLVASISSFKYITDNNKIYESIGVPLLLLGDDGSEWNKANTIRTDSFSFETDFLNLWHTDEKYNDGLNLNNGGGEAYAPGYQLISGADKFKNFGLGKLDIQEMFRYFWNMESSPMTNPYSVMAYYIFDEWDEGYDYEAGNFPYSTVVDDGGIFYSTQKRSNKYDFKFILQNAFLEGMWSPVRLSGENRSIGVDPDITSDQINNNFYWASKSTVLNNDTDLKNAIFDVYNRNFRNRVYLSYLRWRYFYNLGAW